jgi:hypothetical protein
MASNQLWSLRERGRAGEKCRHKRAMFLQTLQAEDISEFIAKWLN